jgi:WD40 repeat protein
VAFSHDGQSVLTGSEDGTVRLWNAGNGKNLHTLKARAR